MKKIFSKELAALAVLAMAFTGCNTAFEGSTANFSEKEDQYTDRSGATQTVNNTGSVSFSGRLNVKSTKNEVTVTITSFSKIDLASADKAIAFQHLTKNSADDNYYPIRGAELPKERIHVSETNDSAIITYLVDATSVKEDRIAFFVDATKLKTKGGTKVLALDGNLKRGEATDSYIEYLMAGYELGNYEDTPVSTGTGAEIIGYSYSPISGTYGYYPEDADGKWTGVYRYAIKAANAKNRFDSSAEDAWESNLAGTLNKSYVLQYREPTSSSYKEKKLEFTYHEKDSTDMSKDPYEEHEYTADFGPFPVGTEYRVIASKPAGLKAPAWYIEVYGWEGNCYAAGEQSGAKDEVWNESKETFIPELPTYIIDSAIDADKDTSKFMGADANVVTPIQNTLLSVTNMGNWFQVTLRKGKFDKNACTDFILIDSNENKVPSKVTPFYDDDGDVKYIKVEATTKAYKDSLARIVRCYADPNDSSKPAKIRFDSDNYRYVLDDENGEYVEDFGYPLYVTNEYGSSIQLNNIVEVNLLPDLSLYVGKGTKIAENTKYPSMVTFGKWDDVIDGAHKGYVKLN